MTTLGRFDTSAYQQLLEEHARQRPLAEQQLLLLDLVRQGSSNREIAQRMETTPASVKTAIQLLKTRLRVATRAELIDLATSLSDPTPHRSARGIGMDRSGAGNQARPRW